MNDGRQVRRLLSAVLIFATAVCIGCSSSDGSPNSSSNAPTEEEEWPETFELGREATTKEIDSLDTDVGPDGRGLPKGAGHVLTGRIVFEEKCSRCHGKGGIGGPFGSLVYDSTLAVAKDARKEKTIGNYWPYATTVYDYVYRAMPYDQPGSLSAQEVYDITAYILYANRLIDSTSVVTQETLPKVSMPARHLFIDDDRKGGPEVR
jgi:cytochrome c